MRLTVSERVRYMTLPKIAKELGIDRKTALNHIVLGVLPPPTLVRLDGPRTFRLFDRKWLQEAKRARKAYLENSGELRSADKGGDESQTGQV